MPLLPKELLKSFFESGDRPSAVHFASLIDSMMHLSDDRHIIGLRVYESARTYLPGDATLFDNSLYLCIAETTGAFSPAAWQPVMSAGAVTYMGTWNAQTNTPALQLKECFLLLCHGLVGVLTKSSCCMNTLLRFCNAFL